MLALALLRRTPRGSNQPDRLNRHKQHRRSSAHWEMGRTAAGSRATAL